MEVTRLPFDKIPQLAQKDIAYATGHPALRPFFKYDVDLASFRQVIDDKKKDPIDRKVLVEVLREQYAELDTTEAVRRNIDALLDERTFTVTTAHQPCLFTGPLYYIYKIFSTINLAEQLQKEYPDYHFVPLFISGGEDHDFEEINHTHVFGKTIRWENDESGPVGMMSCSSLETPLAELRDILGDSENAAGVYNLIAGAYTSHERYGEATADLVNRLFGAYGLVTLNMTHAKLKRLFIPFMRDELLEQPSQALVEATTARLEEAGFSGQAYARPINLFYLGSELNMRERIERENDQFKVVDTSISMNEAEILRELEAHPERFSPNVVMRPIYQELILPNLAYIGGGGELAYWLERQSQFAHFGINYPMLIRRNSVLWIDRGSAKRMDKLGLTINDLFEDVEELVKRYVRENTENELSLSDEKRQLAGLFQAIKDKATDIDKSLAQSTDAELAKAMKSIENLETKLIRAEKQRHDIAINQIRSLKDKLFPENGLQERYDNFTGFFLRRGQGFFDVLKEHLNPLESGFIIVEEN